MFFKSKRCKAGFFKKGNRCFKRERVKDLRSGSVCTLDGKSYCKKGDKPLRPIIARAGGKSQLADKIISKMNSHEIYNEPFVGGGAVFLKKPLAKKNYINDKDKDVITVYKSFKNKVGFQKCNMIPSKRKFDRIKNKKNKNACDVAYLNKLSFGSKMGTFYKKRFPINKKDLGISYQNAHKDDYKEKLEKANITSQDFKQVMKKADSKKTVHFLDPPYYGKASISANYKEKGVTPKEVCDTAKKMNGQVLITYNDHPEVRKQCKGLKKHKISSRYALNNFDGIKKSKELLIIKN